ncbi:CRISPR-associated endonuclease Cas1 [Vibrio sp. FJH11]
MDVAPLRPLLPIKGISVTLRWLSDTNIKPFHQPALSAFLRSLIEAKTAFNECLVIDCPESPRIHYKAGDYYRFNVIAFSPADNSLYHLMEQLASLPLGAPRKGPKLPFRDNLTVISINDMFTDQPIEDFFQLSEYDEDTLLTEASLWQYQSFRIEWLSPARLTRQKSIKDQSKGKARYCRDRQHLDASLFVERVYNAISNLTRQIGADSPYQIPYPLPSSTQHSECFWVDVNYTDGNGKNNKMGGLLGSIPFEGISDDWLPFLVLGQYLGIGARRSFGWGRYILITHDDAISFRRPLAAHSILSELRDDNLLEDAWLHMRQGKTTTPIELKESVTSQLEKIKNNANRLLNNEYTPPVLTRFALNKEGKESRELLVAPIEDRALQRAVAKILTPICESLFCHHSYGYRPGRSRLTARDRISHLIRKGHKWIVEADIRRFFDTVDHKKLRSRVNGIFHDEQLTQSIMAWMSAPIDGEKNPTPRQIGLPQGSPLSPLMANLLLDDFDNDMENQGFQCIRYADDFVILCKSQASAERGLNAARASLIEHGFQLNQNKTRILPAEKGFHFLGYLFLNDLAIEQEKPSSSYQRTDTTLQPKPRVDDVPPSISLPHSHNNNNTFTPHARMVCIAGERSVLRCDHQRLDIKRDKELLASVPWRQVRSLIIFGNHHITTPAITTALRHNVAVHFASTMGQYIGTAGNGRPPHGPLLWQRQIEQFNDPEVALTLAKRLMVARIRNQREVLRKRKCDISALQGIEDEIIRADNSQTLNGIEGNASHIYFQSFTTLLPEWANFDGRNRRPPLDPFNSLLSLGYTLLFGYCDSIARADGLYTWLGFYHKERSGHAALASDLMEPFRHEVERLAATLLVKKQLTNAHFFTQSSGACSLEKEARKWYLQKLTAQFMREIKSKTDGQTGTFVEHIHRQNLSLIRAMSNDTPFAPWEI